MTHDDRQLVNWFKAELRSYLNSEAMLKNLDQKIKELDDMLSYHSPSLSAEPHGNGLTNDEKLVKYITLRSRFLAQYESIELRQTAVESILSVIPDDLREIIVRVAKGLTTIEYEGYKAHLTKSGMQGVIDRAILKAVKGFTNQKE